MTKPVFVILNYVSVKSQAKTQSKFWLLNAAPEDPTWEEFGNLLQVVSDALEIFSSLVERRVFVDVEGEANGFLVRSSVMAVKAACAAGPTDAAIVCKVGRPNLDCCILPSTKGQL